MEDIAGAKVSDPYRWMEGGENKEFDDWLVAQGRYAAAQLARLPGHDALLAKIREVGLGTSGIGSIQRVGDRLFYFSIPANAQLARVEYRDLSNPRSEPKVLVDPTARAVAGGHAAIDNYEASPDGKRLAYNLSQGGSEITDIHVIDVDTGTELPDVVQRIWGEFSASWLPDGSGFFYVQMAEPVAGVDPILGMRVKLHRLGKPSSEDVVVLDGTRSSSFSLEPKDLPAIHVSLASKWVIATASGARSSERVAVARLDSLDLSGAANTRWTVVAGYEDGVEDADVLGDRVYLRSHKDASNRRILSVPAAQPTLAKAKIEVPEDKNAPLTSFALAKDGIYIRDLTGGHSRVRRQAWNNEATTLPLPYEGTIDQFVGDPRRGGISVKLEGWTHPAELFDWDQKRGALVSTGLSARSPADTTSLVAEEVEATSADGTLVPISILHRKDAALDGSHPTILNGYGGYGISQTPVFSPLLTVWIERGGVYAICHVRGGGEKGEAWHVDGMGPLKMNGIRDLIACAEYLLGKGYTNSAHLAAQGGSMGGVLIGRAITERPDLFAAAHIGAGAVNPLRVLHAENGENQVAEIGSPDTPEGAKALLEMDPYQHVAAGVAYPAVLFTVGINDRRVAPWMTGKMAARLQASSSSHRPVLVRTDGDAGHGVGSTRDQAYAERADIWSFLLAAFGDPAFVAR